MVISLLNSQCLTSGKNSSDDQRLMSGKNPSNDQHSMREGALVNFQRLTSKLVERLPFVKLPTFDEQSLKHSSSNNQRSRATSSKIKSSTNSGTESRRPESH